MVISAMDVCPLCYCSFFFSSPLSRLQHGAQIKPGVHPVFSNESVLGSLLIQMQCEKSE